MAKEKAVKAEVPKGVLAKQVKMVSLTEIRPYWRNPRNNDEAVGFVSESIKRYGFIVPLVLDSENVIISGHCRYRAAQQLKLKKVPVIVMDVPEAKAREFRIADNKTSEFAVWDKEKLAEELASLADLTAVKDLFAGPEWMALLSKQFGDEFSQDSANDPSGDGQKLQDASQDVEVPCPHCGETNTFHVDAEGKVVGALENEAVVKPQKAQEAPKRKSKGKGGEAEPEATQTRRRKKS